MRSTLNHHSDPNKTVRQVLPYEFRMRGDGKLVIINTRGQTLIVSRVDVANILTREDLNPPLDPHRRKMYEAALEEFERNDQPPSAKAAFPLKGEREVQ